MKLKIDKKNKKLIVSYKGKKKKYSDAQMRKDLADDMNECRRQIKVLNDRLNKTWSQPMSNEIATRRDALRAEIKRLEEKNHSLRAEYLALKGSQKEIRKELIHIIGMTVIVFTVVGSEKIGQNILTGQAKDVSGKILNHLIK